MSRSNLTDAISAIDRCSDDELRQIQALIAVRLGSPNPSTTWVGTGQKAGGGSAARRGGKTKAAAKLAKGSGKTIRKKGNPQKTSQYATHPAYIAYKTTKKVVERLSKEGKVPFKEVTGEAREKYMEALSNWLRTKAGFRAPAKKGAESGSQPEASQKAESGTGTLVSQTGQAEPDPPVEVETPTKKKRKLGTSAEKANRPPKEWKEKPPQSWTAAGGRDWSSLSRKEKRRAWGFPVQVDSETDMGEE